QSSSGVGVGGYASAGSGFTRGVYGQSDSSGGYGLHGYSPGGVGVVGTTLSGIAVSAQGSGGNSTALEVKNGAIKVNGASPPVFVLTVHAGVNTCLSGQAISIDSPYSNNNPNAIILVTFSTVGQFFPVSLPTVFVAYFNSDVGGCPGHFWLIRNTDASALQDNLRLNVMIIDP
ncbi:MAG: hypothetical protein QOI77_3330, partial [Blastocatellia bacterium]|nr:hypothetical protein [Blastocatellia bacterium]